MRADEATLLSLCIDRGIKANLHGSLLTDGERERERDETEISSTTAGEIFVDLSLLSPDDDCQIRMYLDK